VTFSDIWRYIFSDKWPTTSRFDFALRYRDVTSSAQLDLKQKCRAGPYPACVMTPCPRPL